jgi:hypothetical protein
MMFQFTDFDSDGMIDMIATLESQVNIHYNKLANEMKAQKSKDGLHLFTLKEVCAATTRPINLIKDMFTPPEKASKDTANVV